MHPWVLSRTSVKEQGHGCPSGGFPWEKGLLSPQSLSPKVHGLHWGPLDVVHSVGFDKGIVTYGVPRWLSGKESSCQCRRYRRLGFDPWVGRIPWSRKWQPTPVVLPGRSHGQRSLMGYGPWGHNKSWTRLKRLNSSVDIVACIQHYGVVRVSHAVCCHVATLP